MQSAWRMQALCESTPGGVTGESVSGAKSAAKRLGTAASTTRSGWSFSSLAPRSLSSPFPRHPALWLSCSCPVRLLFDVSMPCMHLGNTTFCVCLPDNWDCLSSGSAARGDDSARLFCQENDARQQPSPPPLGLFVFVFVFVCLLFFRGSHALFLF